MKTMAVQKKSAPPSATARAGGSGRATTGAPAPSTSNAGQRASYNPEDFVQGGLLDDVDVTFDSVRFCEFDYNGSIDTPVLALLVNMSYDEGGDVKTTDQYYSAGDLKRFQPSEDGCHAISVGGGKGLASGTNVAELLKSLKDAGFPMEKLAEDAGMSSLDGLFCHINRIPQKERKGIKAQEREFQATVAIVTKIHRMPWEKPGSKTASKTTAINAKTTAAKPAPATAAEALASNNSGIEPEAAEKLLEVLKAKGGAVKQTGLAPASFKVLAGNPNRGAILELFAQTGEGCFLDKGGDYGWDWDDVTVSLPKD